MWNPFEEVKKLIPGGGGNNYGLGGAVSELILPGSAPLTNFTGNAFPGLNIGQFDFSVGKDGFWDNPFSNLARELSGQNGGFFNPFELGVQLGDPNAIEWRDKWANMQGWASDAVHSNVDNTVGEVAGTNKQRQQQWEQKVEQDAKDAQVKYFQEQLNFKQKSDIAGSNAAARNRGSSSRSGRNLNWAMNGADVTDFLGL